jgi:hypothetical protein
MTTLGDMIYENATPAPAKLSGNITTTKEYLSQTGNGTISAAPVWAQINYADIAGTTPTPPSGAVLWSALGNAAADLTLANGAFNTTIGGTGFFKVGGIMNAVTGYQVNGAAANGTSLVGNGTNYVSENTADFYPETYGAVGDNSHDDTTAIQNCINAVIANGGGTVRLGPHTYKITSGLTMISAYNVNIAGINAGISILSCTSASADILSMSLSTGTVAFCVLQDFSLARTQAPTGTAKGLNVSGLYINIYRVESSDSIYNFYQAGGNANINYHNCISHTSIAGTYTGYGFYYASGGENSSRNVDCLIDNNASVSGGYYGLYLNGADGGNGSIRDLYCEGLETALCDYGVYITGSSFHADNSGNNDNIRFIRCIHDQVTANAYYITGVYGAAANILISDGYVEGQQAHPQIDIENSSGVVVTNMSINCSAGDNSTGACGVYINGAHSTNNVVSDNLFITRYNTNSTIVPVLLNACSDNIVSNNSIRALQTYPIAVGIKLLGSSYNTVDGNNISGWGTLGIGLDSSSTYNQGSNVVDTTSITTAVTDAGTYNSVTGATTLSLLGSDTGLSRIAGGTIAIGNGIQGNFTGSLKLYSELLTGTGANLVISDTAANTDLSLLNTTASFTYGSLPTRGLGATNANAFGTNSITLNINVGDTVVIFVNTNSGTAPTVSDNGSTSNTYVQVGAKNTNWGNSYCFVCLSAGFIATTVTQGGTGSAFSIGGVTYVGVGSVGATHSTATGSTSPISDAITTTTGNSIVVSGMMGSSIHTNFAATSGTKLAGCIATVDMEIVVQSQATANTLTTNSGTFTGASSGWEVITLELESAGSSVANESSPLISISGTYWNGSASATDAWTIQDVISNVTNGTSTLTFSHSGSSGSAAVQVPLLDIGGTDAGISRLGAASLALGNGTAADFSGSLKLGTLVATAAAPTVAASQIGYGATTSATASTTGGGLTLPLLAAGYIVVNIAGTNYKVAYYAS